MCVLLNGVPHGPAFFKYYDPKNKHLSFTGVGIFNQGTLHNAPFIFIGRDKEGHQFSKMENGRPAPSSIKTTFYPEESFGYFSSIKEKTDVSGY